MINANEVRVYFESYRWEGKHSLFGYPSDEFPDFFWIRNLESRFGYVRENRNSLNKQAPLFLLREMIKWGGSKKSDVSPKFDDYIGTYCLAKKLAKVVDCLGDTRQAIEAALDIPGLGLTYASKLLRFLQPGNYGALDKRIAKATKRDIQERVLSVNGAKSKDVDRYVAYIEILRELKNELRRTTGETWEVAEIEMADFQWATEKKKGC